MTPHFDDPRIEAIYQAGLAAIARNRSLNQFDTDGTLVLPFQCYGCDERRVDFCLLTGDGLPMCRRCLAVISAFDPTVDQ